MSIMPCENCDEMIDTDFDNEHFEECQKETLGDLMDKMGKQVKELQALIDKL